MSDLNLLEPDVRAAVERVLALGPKGLAAFDADGTIWRGDVGEDFLRELIAEGRLIDPPPGDLFAQYEGLVHVDGKRAFSLCVEWMKGLAHTDVAAWSHALVERSYTSQVFPGIRAALKAFREAGTRVVIVSASNVWSVQAGARMLGLDPADVLAVNCPLDAHGRLTGEVADPVTCSQGKVDALKGHLGSRTPDIAFGNSPFDREMLEHAARAVMVAPADRETPGLALARQKGWLVHRHP